MHVRFAELAKLEFDDARAWYRAIRPELGRAFSQEVRTATQRINTVPQITGWIAVLTLEPLAFSAWVTIRLAVCAPGALWRSLFNSCSRM